MKKENKPFKLNVIVSYSKSTRINNYRGLIPSVLRNFAMLYKLDYSIEINSQLFSEPESEILSETDLIYFRTNTPTQIGLKEFQKLILTIIPYSLPYEGIHVSYLLQKFSREYPFPNTFYRPLNYPFCQLHKDGHIEQILFVEGLTEDLLNK